MSININELTNPTADNETTETSSSMFGYIPSRQYVLRVVDKTFKNAGTPGDKDYKQRVDLELEICWPESVLAYPPGRDPAEEVKEIDIPVAGTKLTIYHRMVHGKKSNGLLEIAQLLTDCGIKIPTDGAGNIEVANIEECIDELFGKFVKCKVSSEQQFERDDQGDIIKDMDTGEKLTRGFRASAWLRDIAGLASEDYTKNALNWCTTRDEKAEMAAQAAG